MYYIAPADLFVYLLIGHCIGDYLLQTNKMAVNKIVPGIIGVYWCTLHCVVYTLSIMFLINVYTVPVFLFIFLSHYPIDRWSFANYILKLKGNVLWKDVPSITLDNENIRPSLAAHSFALYLITDNFIHLLIMWIGLILIFGIGA